MNILNENSTYAWALAAFTVWFVKIFFLRQAKSRLNHLYEQINMRYNLLLKQENPDLSDVTVEQPPMRLMILSARSNDDNLKEILETEEADKFLSLQTILYGFILFCSTITGILRGTTMVSMKLFVILIFDKELDFRENKFFYLLIIFMCSCGIFNLINLTQMQKLFS